MSAHVCVCFCFFPCCIKIYCLHIQSFFGLSWFHFFSSFKTKIRLRHQMHTLHFHIIRVLHIFSILFFSLHYGIMSIKNSIFSRIYYFVRRFILLSLNCKIFLFFQKSWIFCCCLSLCALLLKISNRDACTYAANHFNAFKLRMNKKTVYKWIVMINGQHMLGPYKISKNNKKKDEQ